MPKFICSALIKAIDAFIEKADNDLEDKLNEAGFINAKESIKKESILEEVIAVILLSQSNNMAKHLLKNKGKIKGDFSDKQEEIREIINEFFENDTTKGEIQQAVESFYLDNIQEHTDGYIKSVSEDMAVERIRQRTFSKIEEWSEELSRLMKISQEKQLGKLIEDTLKAGGSVDDLAGKLMKEGIRNEYYQARRVAVTEMLRFNSIAQDEAMQQDPSVDKKEWKHTGSRKNNPRANHVNMNGQIVEKDKPYKLIGRNGSIHYPMYPRDTSLPAEESINCHCISQPILNDKVFGLSLEERRKLQQEIIDADDRKWEEEYAENKYKAGINEDTINFDWIRKKSKEEQIKYLGGGHAGKARWALFESGVITNDKELERLYRRDDKGRRVKKSLKELGDSGIITVSYKTLKHSTVGEFTGLGNPKKPPSPKNGGKMKNGGHSQSNIEELKRRGFQYRIAHTYNNGVRIGEVEEHKDSEKRFDEDGQAWFPKTWDDDKVLVAGTYIANKGTLEIQNDNPFRCDYVGTYKGIKITIICDRDKRIPSTIFPNDKQ